MNSDVNLVWCVLKLFRPIWNSSAMEDKSQRPMNDTAEAVPSRKAFPKLLEQFGEDPRVSYSKLDGKWILEDEDGSEWEFNDNLMRWMPSVRKANAKFEFLQ